MAVRTAKRLPWRQGLFESDALEAARRHGSERLLTTAVVVVLSVLAIGSRLAEWVLVRDRSIGVRPQGIFAVVFWTSLAALVLLLLMDGDLSVLTEKSPS